MSGRRRVIHINTAPHLGPVTPEKRISTIDILRGVAIFGILVVNVTLDVPWHFLLGKLWPGPADWLAKGLIHFLASGKFLNLFSLLFGLSFSLHMGRVEARGIPFLPLYARRLIVLFFIGLAHWLLGWGDIVHFYAVFGFLLLPFRGSASRRLVIAAFICLLIPHAVGVFVTARHEAQLRHPATARQTIRQAAQEVAEEKTQQEQALRVYSQGSFPEIVAQRAQEFARSEFSLRTWLNVFGLSFSSFLLGLYVGRQRILEDVPGHIVFVRRVLWWGLGLGLVGMSVDVVFGHLMKNPAQPFLTSQVTSLFWDVGTKALSFFYAAAVVLLAQGETWKDLLAPLAAVGRMALSNYLFQSLIVAIIIYPYGFGLFGRFGPTQGVILAFLIFPLQVLLSVWWIRRFRFGPVEWLWRTLTYGKLQPMRV